MRQNVKCGSYGRKRFRALIPDEPAIKPDDAKVFRRTERDSKLRDGQVHRQSGLLHRDAEDVWLLGLG